MKCSVSDKYPGFPVTPELALVAEIYFNGSRLFDCLVADSDRGVVICIKRDRRGNIMRQGDEFLTMARHGNVCIYVPPEYEHLK